MKRYMAINSVGDSQEFDATGAQEASKYVSDNLDNSYTWTIWVMVEVVGVIA